MARRTQSEYKDNSARHQESTDARVKEHREVQKDAEKALDGFNAATNFEIRITECADRLRKIGEDLDREVLHESERQSEGIDESVASEKREVSDESREGQRESEDQSAKAEAASPMAGRFAEAVSEVADELREEAQFFAETADDSEKHQQEVHAESKRTQEHIQSQVSQRRRS